MRTSTRTYTCVRRLSKTRARSSKTCISEFRRLISIGVALRMSKRDLRIGKTPRLTPSDINALHLVSHRAQPIDIQSFIECMDDISRLYDEHREAVREFAMSIALSEWKIAYNYFCGIKYKDTVDCVNGLTGDMDIVCWCVRLKRHIIVDFVGGPATRANEMEQELLSVMPQAATKPRMSAPRL